MSMWSRSGRRTVARKMFSLTSSPERLSVQTDLQRPGLNAVPARRGLERGKESAMKNATAAMKGAIYVGLVAISLVPAMFLVPATAAAEAQQRQPTPKITEEQATTIALERIPGKVTEVTIERKRGKYVYVVEIQTPDAGEKDVFVDIQTGEIVGTD